MNVNKRIVAKLAVEACIVAIVVLLLGPWLRSHDILTGAALVLLALIVAAKITFAIIARRRGGFGPPGGGLPPYPPVPIPPVRPRPPELTGANILR